MAEYMEEFKFPDEQELEDKAMKDAEDKANAAPPEPEIEVVDDTPADDRNRKAAEAPQDVPEDELANYDKGVQARIKKFTRGYHDERRAKEAALREREEAIRAAQAIMEENKRLQQQLEEGSKVFIEQGKSSAQLELDSAKRAFKDAYEAGDSEALAEAQYRMAQATLRLDKADSLKPLQTREIDVQIPQYQSQAQNPQLDSRTAEWLEDNPWYGDDDEMSASALGLHKKLEKQFGKQYIGSEEYFKTIDDTMKRRFPEYFGSEEVKDNTEKEEEPPTRAKPASNVVAPATRSTAPSKIKLTKTQVAIAKKLGVPLELYAKKVAEQNKGAQ